MDKFFDLWAINGIVLVYWDIAILYTIVTNII